MSTQLTTGILSMLFISSGFAATVNFSITLGPSVSTSGGLSPGQTFQGNVAYNQNLVPTTGNKSLNRVDDATLTLNLTFAGDFYTSVHDTDYPAFPEFYFVDGEIHGITFYAKNRNPASNADGFIQIEGINQIFTYSFDGNTEYSGTVSWPITAIPEPSNALLGAMGTLLLLCNRRNRMS